MNLSELTGGAVPPHMVGNDHYVTAAAMNPNGWTVLACRCGWLRRSNEPVEVWSEHLRERRQG